METTIKKISVIILAIVFCLDANAITNALKIKVNSGTYADETVVRFLSNATTGFDSNYDAYKMFSLNPLVPSVFTKKDSLSYLCINALPTLNKETDVELFVHVKSAGMFTFQAIELGAFEAGVKIVLEDKATGIFYDFRNGTSISFSLNANALNSPSRFIIHFSPATNLGVTTGVAANVLPDPLHVYLQDGSMVLNMKKLLSPSKIEINVYSITGQQIYHYSNNEIYILSESVVLSTAGIYIINSVIDNVVHSQKISYTK